MKDTIIKGSGNSRTLKTVPNIAALAPTYDKLLELLTGEGLPIDIGPLNPAGVDTMGTSLDKANLLKDTTAALYGLDAEAVPDDVLQLLGSALTLKNGNLVLPNGSAFHAVECGSYDGTAGMSETSPKTIYLSFTPSAALVFSDKFLFNYSGSNNVQYWHFWCTRDFPFKTKCQQNALQIKGNSLIVDNRTTSQVSASTDQKWYEYICGNNTGYTYYYFAFR